MNTIFLGLLSSCLISGLCISPSINAQSKKDIIDNHPYSISGLSFNSSLYVKYQKLTSQSILLNSSKLEKTTVFNDSFEDILNIENPEYTVVEEDNNGEISAAIVYEQSSDQLIYTEYNGNKENFAICTENSQYLVESDGYNISLLSDTGEKTNILTTDLEPEVEQIELTDLFTEKDVTTRTTASWIYTSYKGRYGTLNAYVKVLNAVSKLVSVTNLGVPFLNTALSFLFNSYASSISTGNITVYIEFDNAYRSDCTTYTRKDVRLHELSYTGHIIKSYTAYIHNTRPDYAGQNCMAYA